MVNAVLTEANLVKTSFAGAQLYGTALLDHADLQGADFSNSILAGLNLNQAHLRGAIFDGAILINASLREVDFTPTIDGNATKFVGANLIGTDFRGAHLNSANLDNAVIALDQGVPLFTVKDLVQWQPDLDKNLLSTALREVFQNREAARETGKRARAKVEAGWTWKDAAAKALTRIQALTKAPALRYQIQADAAVLIDGILVEDLDSLIESLQRHTYASIAAFVRCAVPVEVRGRYPQIEFLGDRDFNSTSSIFGHGCEPPTSLSSRIPFGFQNIG